MTARAVWMWTAVCVRTLLREKMVVRALVGPSAIVMATTMLTVGVVASTPPDGPVMVADASWVPRLEESGIRAEWIDNPDDLFAREQTNRILVWENDRWVIRVRHSGIGRWSARRAHADLAIEEVVRRTIGAGWQVSVPLLPAVSADLPRSVDTLRRLLGVLFSLYAVVLATAGPIRDRETGVQEAWGTMPVPPWVAPLARVVGVVVVVGGALVWTDAVMGSVYGVAFDARGAFAGVASVALGAALGTAAPAGRSWRPVGPWSGAPAGLTGPLSSALVVAMGVASLGWTLPAVGRFLPLGFLVTGAGTWWEAGFGALFSVGAVGVSVIRAAAARW